MTLGTRTSSFVGVPCAFLPLGPLGCECAQHRPTPRPSLERITAQDKEKATLIELFSDQKKALFPSGPVL